MDGTTSTSGGAARVTMTQHHGVDSVAALKRENARLRKALEYVMAMLGVDGEHVACIERACVFCSADVLEAFTSAKDALEGKD